MKGRFERDNLISIFFGVVILFGKIVLDGLQFLIFNFFF